MSSVTPEAARENYQSHFDSAVAIAEQSPSWACVAMFYAAYHLMRLAFLEDPVFQSDRRLREVNVRLTVEDQIPRHHNGRRGGDGGRLGQNEVVRLLYPHAAAPYERLHQASIAVRYQNSRLADAQRCQEDLELLIGMYNGGQLRRG